MTVHQHREAVPERPRAEMTGRVRRIGILLALVGLVAACSHANNASKGTDDGQSDYLGQVLALFDNCAGPQLDATTGPSQYADVLRSRAAAWDKLRPPSDLTAAHDAYGQSMLRTADLLSQLSSTDRLTPHPDEATRITESARSFQDAVARHYGVTFFKNLGASMKPTFSDGDTLAVKPLNDAIERWEILVFKFPLDRTREFIKRVVGLPGETVEVRDGTIYVNGAAIGGDTYALEPPNYAYPSRTVPADSFFVLGDNRRNSFDSHAWGAACSPEQACDFVSRADVIGAVPADTKGCRDARA